MSTGRRGRPTEPNPRVRNINVRLNDDEREALVRVAKAQGLSMSAFMRMLVLVHIRRDGAKT